MKTQAEIEAFLKELKERYSSSANMNYERGGAVDALEWVLSKEESKPIIGHR